MSDNMQVVDTGRDVWILYYNAYDEPPFAVFSSLDKAQRFCAADSVGRRFGEGASLEWVTQSEDSVCNDIWRIERFALDTKLEAERSELLAKLAALDPEF